MEDAIRIINGLDTSNSEENIKKQIPKKVIKKNMKAKK